MKVKCKSSLKEKIKDKIVDHIFKTKPGKKSGSYGS